MSDQNKNNAFQEQEANLFFEESISGFLIADEKNRIIRSNKRVSDWLGISPANIEGKKFSDLLSIGSKIYFETHLSPLLKMQGYFEEILVELSGAAGKRLKILINAKESASKEEGSKLIYYTLLKASDRVQYEQNLQNAKRLTEEELEGERKNVILREQLIAVLGHDLRNPLGAISMTVGLLERSVKDDRQKNLLGILKRSSYRMNELIGNVMDFARTRLGEGIVISPREVDLKPVLEHVMAELKFLFPDRQIEADLSLIDPIFCDADRIAQLVSNLLANALTHGNPQSPVYFTARNPSNKLEISVANEGEPIPESLQAILFTPFKREADRPSNNGLGLGLYIADQIAQAHGGTLSFVSDEKETRFTFVMDCNI
ncbi:PAS domain-containing sensor histidine kinase [Kaistella sp. G5-32]|uniref:histidine kinase n=1 Tax=Kaistella gelatinilytica TaxID=2787636 RepID=A0ABS0F8V7_9FLAO|nr:PAS domain-containing sensor histidine kinase [Kaistella gelatinilytica]MBF8456147.1 PAS domain-containing sensor histidine kinase [Kaistella gelatinilytica]